MPGGRELRTGHRALTRATSDLPRPGLPGTGARPLNELVDSSAHLETAAANTSDHPTVKMTNSTPLTALNANAFRISALKAWGRNISGCRYAGTTSATTIQVASGCERQPHRGQDDPHEQQIDVRLSQPAQVTHANAPQYLRALGGEHHPPP